MRLTSPAGRDSDAAAVLEVLEETIDHVFPNSGYSVRLGPGTCELPGDYQNVSISVIVDTDATASFVPEVMEYWDSRTDIGEITLETTRIYSSVGDAGTLTFTSFREMNRVSFSSIAGGCSPEPVTATSYDVPASGG